MIQLVDIDKVRASTYNPRKADPYRLDMLELSLRKIGFVMPIYVDIHGEILSGHQRHHVAKRMGATKIPVEVVKELSLKKRKNYNIIFNRATNDLKKSDTSESITKKLKNADIHELANKLPDIEVDTPEFYPCLNATAYLDVQTVAKNNIEKMHSYARGMASMLKNIGVEMAIVVDEEGSVVNGIGRVQLAAETKKKVIKAVVLPKEKVEFTNIMLNYISMDFDINSSYADVLRHNSFMRSRNTREEGLGNGFYKGIYPRGKGVDFNPLKGEALDKWKKRYGTSIVDFGAGKLYNTRILREAGIECSAFEPYFVASGEDVSKKVSIQLAREFLADVASGKEFSTIFISSVFNSVPFMEDRKKIAIICASLCSKDTMLVCWAQSTKASQLTSVKRQRVGSDPKTFSIDYEPNVVMGDLSKYPKVQKFHTDKEFIDIFGPCFEKITRLEIIDAFLYMEAVGGKVLVDELREALEFEFDLPYPDGTRMGLVEEAKAAFSKRLGISL